MTTDFITRPGTQQPLRPVTFPCTLYFLIKWLIIDVFDFFKIFTFAIFDLHKKSCKQSINNIYLIAPVYELSDKPLASTFMKNSQTWKTCHCIIHDKKFQKHIIYPGICIIICLYFQDQTFKTNKTKCMKYIY